ncbi:uncharacterized protein LOC125821630 [Solanum verrucosum]|uniref:uncharacterized protein LOC125821630 n=1 Tax=Solanum verrucosum TaxID=315347 RepID=UPI0020D05161|nr:uncharacterized protein LOC125821630 [Solanum verrucosum]
MEEDPLEFIEEVSRVLHFVRVTPVEKAELAAYQLKDVSLLWLSQWKGVRPVEAGPMEWERFMNGFVDRFFPLEVKEAKILEFVNLHQGRLSVEEYARVFTRLSRYAPSIVANPKMKMSKFVSGLSNLIIRECSMVMLENDMAMDRLVIHAQRFENEKFEERSRGTKRYRLEDDDSSQEGSYGQSHSNIPPKFNQKEVSTLKSKGVSGSGSYVVSPTCARCGKKHNGKCLAGTKGCYGCGGSDHLIRNCPIITARGREMKKIRTDVLQGRGEQKCPPNVATGMCFMLTSIPIILVFCDLINWI